jgi:hypothetical protein
VRGPGPSTSQGSQVVRRTTAVALALLVALSACSGAEDTPSADDRSTAGDAAGVTPEPGELTVEVAGDELRLRRPDATSRTLATLDPAEDGELVHATVRPGDHGTLTVLALTRSATDTGPRYELRYLVADEEAASALYWFPWRLQVEEGLTAVLDAPPLPVWSPDGTAVAWVEWDATGTRLRTVGWRDEGASSNPSDEASAYRLDGVPPGIQLDTWEVGRDGVPVLRGLEGETVWRIRLDVGRAAIAMPEPG